MKKDLREILPGAEPRFGRGGAQRFYMGPQVMIKESWYYRFSAGRIMENAI